MRSNQSIRLFVQEYLNSAVSITLPQEQSHYLANVMRLKPGATVSLFNGKDGEWDAVLTEVNKRSVSLEVKEQVRPQKPEPDVWLVFAPIKKARLDFIAQKATELGAGHLQPIYTQRTIVDRVKEERLQANAVEAAEQCERLSVPTVADPVKLDKLLDDWPPERRIMFCDEDLTGTPAHTALQKVARTSATDPWAIIIGPEGGFTDEERARMKAMPQTVTVSLGPRVLRADTAAMAALTLWQSAIGDW